MHFQVQARSWRPLVNRAHGSTKPCFVRLSEVQIGHQLIRKVFAMQRHLPQTLRQLADIIAMAAGVIDVSQYVRIADDFPYDFPGVLQE